MGKTSKNSVVDPDCQVWGTDGLYVVDASVFPSASGVNPMVTNMAIADWASRNVARALGKPRSERNGMARL
jgi:choline dehydrogenase-like flavoprotein